MHRREILGAPQPLPSPARNCPTALEGTRNVLERGRSIGGGRSRDRADGGCLMSHARSAGRTLAQAMRMTTRARRQAAPGIGRPFGEVDDCPVTAVDRSGRRTIARRNGRSRTGSYGSLGPSGGPRVSRALPAARRTSAPPFRTPARVSVRWLARPYDSSGNSDAFSEKRTIDREVGTPAGPGKSASYEFTRRFRRVVNIGSGPSRSYPCSGIPLAAPRAPPCS